MIGRYQSTGRFRSRADLLATAESRRARLAQRPAQLAVATAVGHPRWPESARLSPPTILPHHVRKLVEVIDGHVIFCQSSTTEHSEVARRLANRLEAAKPAEPRTRVSTDIDVHFVKRKRTPGPALVSGKGPAVDRMGTDEGPKQAL